MKRQPKKKLLPERKLKGRIKINETTVGMKLLMMFILVIGIVGCRSYNVYRDGTEVPKSDNFLSVVRKNAEFRNYINAKGLVLKIEFYVLLESPNSLDKIYYFQAFKKNERNPTYVGGCKQYKLVTFIGDEVYFSQEEVRNNIDLILDSFEKSDVAPYREDLLKGNLCL